MKSYMRREYKLPELFDMYMGKTPDRNNLEYWENGTYPWISIADMTSNGKLIRNTKEYITDKAIRETGIKPINYNTVIMSFKLSVGKVSKVATKECPAYSNEAIMAFEIPPVPVGSPMILNDYAYYLLQSLDFTNAGNKAVMGKTLNKAILQNTAVKIHVDLDVQSEIITVLDKVTDLIDKRKEQLLKLDELVKARFVELFGDPVLNTKGWECKAVIDECGCMVPGRDKPKTFTGDIPWITIEDLKVNGITYESKSGYGLTQDEIDEVNRKAIPKGSVIMSCVGNLGICSIAGKEMIINQQLHSFQCGERLNNIFLMNYLGYRKDYMNKWASNTTVLYMNKSICNSIPVIIPPMELQEQFAAFVEQTDKSKLEFQKSLEKLELLKKALMQKYFG